MVVNLVGFSFKICQVYNFCLPLLLPPWLGYYHLFYLDYYRNWAPCFCLCPITMTVHFEHRAILLKHYVYYVTLLLTTFQWFSTLVKSQSLQGTDPLPPVILVIWFSLLPHAALSLLASTVTLNKSGLLFCLGVSTYFFFFLPTYHIHEVPCLISFISLPVLPLSNANLSVKLPPTLSGGTSYIYYFHNTYIF